MNISVYLPETLKASFDVYVKSNGITQNAAVRKAIELLLEKESKQKWGNWINQLGGDNDFPTLKEIRDDQKPPREDFF